MTEKLLHYIWQYNYYNQGSLATIDGEPVQVIYPGRYNTNQGPDFLEAKCRIGSTVLAGSVEIHIKSSDWHKHGHSMDENYNNVILHVVYEHDAQTGLQEVELKERIPRQLFEHYEMMMQSTNQLPCANSLNSVKEITIASWKERLLTERLENRAAKVFRMLDSNRQHWEEMFWWLIARNFGGPINGESFEAIARSIPLTVLAKHKDQIVQLEALVLGQAGLLRKMGNDKYAALLYREYSFLKKKYGLQPAHRALHFLRMRPANFPPVKLAQLAMLVHRSSHLFSKMIDEESLVEIMNMMRVTANDYWHYHYRLNEESAFHPKKLGSDFIRGIMINTIAPVVFAYGCYKKDEAMRMKSLRWLEELPAEKNVITKEFETIGIGNRNAFDSQALIELKKNYCNEKRCLNCAIGNSILKDNVHLDAKAERRDVSQR